MICFEVLPIFLHFNLHAFQSFLFQFILNVFRYFSLNKCRISDQSELIIQSFNSVFQAMCMMCKHTLNAEDVPRLWEKDSSSSSFIQFMKTKSARTKPDRDRCDGCWQLGQCNQCKGKLAKSEFQAFSKHVSDIATNKHRTNG